jgi:enoyl-CoA hydratase/carnithine racemase
MHIVYPLLLGPNRGRYFLLTGQILSAQQALELGLVNEVVPREQLLPRAWELAEQLAKQPLLTLRYARVALTQELKRQMLDLLGYGLALEGLGALDTTPTKE